MRALTWKTARTQTERTSRGLDAAVNRWLPWTAESLLEISSQTVKVQHLMHNTQPVLFLISIMLLMSCMAEIVASSTQWWWIWGGEPGHVSLYKYQMAACCPKTLSTSCFWELSHISLHSQGCGSDAEAEQVFKMETAQLSPQRTGGRIPPPPPQRKQSLENGQYRSVPLARYRRYTGWATQHTHSRSHVWMLSTDPWGRIRLSHTLDRLQMCSCSNAGLVFTVSFK